MDTDEAIKNLEIMSSTLDKVANKPENYNTEWAHYLEKMSWSLHQHANDLKELKYLLGITQ